MSEMKQCTHCKAFVPAEKAFCPNCSEPMEEEETPDRAHAFGSDMMATIRDDPEKYKQLLQDALQKKKKKPAPPAEAAPPAPAPSAPASSSAPPSPPPVAPPVVNYNAPPPQAPNAAPQAAYAPYAPVPKSKRRRNLLIGMSVVALLILIFVILVAFKVIDIGLFG